MLVIVPERDGNNYGCSQILLDIAQDSFMAAVYPNAFIVALEEFFGRVQIFGDVLALAKYCQKEWPSPTFAVMFNNESVWMVPGTVSAYD